MTFSHEDFQEMERQASTKRRFLAAAQRIRDAKDQHWLPKQSQVPPADPPETWQATRYKQLLLGQLGLVVEKEVRDANNRAIPQVCTKNCKCKAPRPTSPQMGCFQQYEDVRLFYKERNENPVQFSSRGTPQQLATAQKDQARGDCGSSRFLGRRLQ
jgi:hypothetical protein